MRELRKVKWVTRSWCRLVVLFPFQVMTFLQNVRIGCLCGFHSCFVSMQFWLSPFWCLQANLKNLRHREFIFLFHKYLLKAFFMPGPMLTRGDIMASKTLWRKHSTVKTSHHSFSLRLYSICINSVETKFWDHKVVQSSAMYQSSNSNNTKRRSILYCSVMEKVCCFPF